MILKSDAKLGKFSLQHLKVSKFGLWWDPFVQSRKYMSLKLTKKLCVMTMRNNREIEEELTRPFKLIWGIWQILTRAFESHLRFNNGLLVTKVYNVWAKKVQRSYLSWHWKVIQNLKRSPFAVSKLTSSEFDKFSPEHSKV